MEKRDGKKERKKVEKVNMTYILGTPILIIIIVAGCLWLVKDMASQFIGSTPKQATKQKTQQQEMYDPNNQDTPHNGKYLMEDIISGEIEKVLQEEQEAKAAQEQEAQDEKINYKDFTLSQLLNKAKDNMDENSEMLEKDLSIQYVYGSYEGITKDGAIAVNIDKETKYFYLIGVSDLNIDSLYEYLKDEDTIYVEYDINKKSGDAEQAYLWIDTPNNSHKENMINVICLQNGYGSYIDPFPNVKYTYYLCKFK